MNRQQRRALAKIQGKAALGQAAGQIQRAVDALESVKGLDGLPERMAEAQRLMTEAHATVEALVEDYQALADETEVLKAMVFALSGPGAEQSFEQRLAELRSQRSGAT